MRGNWTAAIIALMLAATAQAAERGHGEGALMRALDTNGDGVVSVEEAKANPDLAREFQQYDQNRDGNIDQGEFSRFEMQEQEMEKTPAAPEADDASG